MIQDPKPLPFFVGMCFIQGSITDNGVEISTGKKRNSIDPNGNSSGLEAVKEKQKILFRMKNNSLYVT